MSNAGFPKGLIVLILAISPTNIIQQTSHRFSENKLQRKAQGMWKAPTVMNIMH